jgi:hypothetical protein
LNLVVTARSAHYADLLPLWDCKCEPTSQLSPHIDDMTRVNEMLFSEARLQNS